MDSSLREMFNKTEEIVYFIVNTIIVVCNISGEVRETQINRLMDISINRFIFSDFLLFGSVELDMNRFRER